MLEDNLNILPLYWIYHDQWAYRYWGMTQLQWVVRSTHPHRGHVHFFMPGHKSEDGLQQAYKGAQTFTFSIRNRWAPDSGDPNQSQNMRMIGSPKWHIYVIEYWRRVYIQKWDASVTTGEKKGIKYDASSPAHTMGVHREDKTNFFYWTNMARTLPVEYFKNEKKTIRDHYLRDQAGESRQIWDTDPEHFDPSADKFIIPRNYWTGNGPEGPGNQAPAMASSYPDSLYAHPTIEYQEVLHKNWERPDGYQDRDTSPDSFGDGMLIKVDIPYKNKNGEIQSPFSLDNKVAPFGAYHHGFEEKFPGQIPRYPTQDKEGVLEMYKIPDDLKGQRIRFSVPANIQNSMDGMWVEQCLGGVVLAKALVTMEDNFNGRHDTWVTDPQTIIQSDFEGIDQGL